MKKNIIGIVVILVIGIIAVKAFSSFKKSSQALRTSACVGNLCQLRGAKEGTAIALRLRDGTIVSPSDIDPYIKNGTQTLKCPEDPQKTFKTSYSIEPIGSNPLCLINPASHTL